MVFAVLFVYMVIIKTQNRKPNNIQKTSPQSYKTQIKRQYCVIRSRDSGSENRSVENKMAEEEALCAVLLLVIVIRRTPPPPPTLRGKINCDRHEYSQSTIPRILHFILITFCWVNKLSSILAFAYLISN